jgi:ActR/RegA family two-component response regulator
MLIDDEAAFLGPLKRVLERRNMLVSCGANLERCCREIFGYPWKAFGENP